jgi:hypothetical protein
LKGMTAATRSSRAGCRGSVQYHTISQLSEMKADAAMMAVVLS